MSNTITSAKTRNRAARGFEAVRAGFVSVVDAIAPAMHVAIGASAKRTSINWSSDCAMNPGYTVSKEFCVKKIDRGPALR